ncbi:hypothetical protein PHJA_002539400 [Phtheirospermum japonicum]|uniref:Uncharacterized protein n=1 Tax=Phtheirospermum japonicum TaxID=374723 RepID=A0A830D620_9LAMI|nr:hypothetical protein PHJA_002539400 [Phtheirospermum japonicum]
MRGISSDERGFRVWAFFSSIFLLCVSAYSDDSSTPKIGTKTESHGGSKGSKIALICLALLAVGLLSFFLLRFWQKKKREEQYARLLKLFEEDDELEVELGLRD